MLHYTKVQILGLKMRSKNEEGMELLNEYELWLILKEFLRYPETTTSHLSHGRRKMC